MHYLVRAAGSDANFLLNVGPMPDGRIQPEFVDAAAARWAQWLAGERRRRSTARGGGPIAPRSWGVTTKKGSTVYVHVLDWQDAEIAIPSLGGTPRRATYLKGGGAARFTVQPDGTMLIALDPKARDDYDTVIAFEM